MFFYRLFLCSHALEIHGLRTLTFAVETFCFYVFMHIALSAPLTFRILALWFIGNVLRWEHCCSSLRMSYWWCVRRHARRIMESNGLSIYDPNRYKDLGLLPSFATYYLSMNKLIHLAGLLVFLSVNEVIRPSPIAIFYDAIEQKSQGAPSLSLPFSHQLWLPCSLGSCSSWPINLTFIFALHLESVVLRGWVLLVFIFIFIFPITDWIQKILSQWIE